jgi:hypothetical protein
MVGLSALGGFDVLSISFASPAVAEAWNLAPATLGIVLSMELVGMAIGSLTKTAGVIPRITLLTATERH